MPKSSGQTIKSRLVGLMAPRKKIVLYGSVQVSLAGLAMFDASLDVFVGSGDEFVECCLVGGFAGAELYVAHEFAGAFEETAGVAE